MPGSSTLRCTSCTHQYCAYFATRHWFDCWRCVWQLFERSVLLITSGELQLQIRVKLICSLPTDLLMLLGAQASGQSRFRTVWAFSVDSLVGLPHQFPSSNSLECRLVAGSAVQLYEVLLVCFCISLLSSQLP